MEYYTKPDKQEKISLGKRTPYLREAMWNILHGFRCLESRGYLIYPRTPSHSHMISHVYKKDRRLLDCYRGIIYFTRDDDSLFWIYGVLPISYTQVCYRSGEWSEKQEITASNIIDVMSSRTLLNLWDGDPSRKILLKNIFH